MPVSARQDLHPSSPSEVGHAIAGLQHLFGPTVLMAWVLVELAAAVGPASVRATVVEEESVVVVVASMGHVPAHSAEVLGTSLVGSDILEPLARTVAAGTSAALAASSAAFPVGVRIDLRPWLLHHLLLRSHRHLLLKPLRILQWAEAAGWHSSRFRLRRWTRCRRSLGVCGWRIHVHC